MKTKHIFLTAFAVIALVTASFSNIFSSDNSVTLKCYDEKSYRVTDDSTDGNGGGPKIPPTGN
ncbi:MAG TPA: hypothetical protein PKD94_04160 [Ignavibacteria bacterium]|nr:hypothetical protein [Ignavibacteria bacterium]